MIILDTNVVSELMRPEPAPQVASWVRNRDRRELRTTTITLAEVRYGIARLPDGPRKQVLLAAADDIFTDRARRVIVLAQEEASGLGHHYIGTEHLLLGLITEATAVATRALEALGVTAEAARRRVGEITGRGEPGPARERSQPGSPAGDPADRGRPAREPPRIRARPG